MKPSMALAALAQAVSGRDVSPRLDSRRARA
jgi:hypothetical protein